MLHDISTDLDDPPAFEAVLPLRKGARNPPHHGGEKVAAEQRQAYPWLKPLFLEAAPAEVTAAAERMMRQMGWQVVAVDAGRGRLEAVATTRWLRFRDDVVVRIRAEGGKTRVDMRSKSRLGKSDLGANARRIRAFLRALASGV